MMELSSVFNRIHFLLELINASGDDRIIMLEYITLGQMACIGEIARRIYHHTFPLLIPCTVCEESTFVFDRAFSASAKICLRKREKQDEKKPKSKQHAKGHENKNP